MSCDSKVVTNSAGAMIATALPSGYGRPDLKSAYKLPKGGKGQRVYIVDAFNSATLESDLNTYRSTYGLTACTKATKCLKVLNQSGKASPLPPVDSGWAGEISLDLDMVSAVCPKCKITLIEATSNSNANINAAIDEAVKLGAHIVSMSFGGGEPSASGVAAAEAHFNHAGVAFTASTGDSGFGAQYPATSKFVTAVGGTHLVKSTSGRGWTESAWSGGGSGCSAVISKPAWQSDPGCPRRMEADVSAVADPATGVAVRFGGAWRIFGGTSASAPIIAGVYALAGNASSVTFGSFPYTHTSGLFDITTGANGTCSPSYFCHAGPGYDGPTGLGTPKGVSAF